MSDLESRLRLLTGQFQEEQEALNNKMEEITSKTILSLGKKVRHGKHLLLTFVSVRDQELTQMESQLQRILENNQVNQINSQI